MTTTTQTPQPIPTSCTTPARVLPSAIALPIELAEHNTLLVDPDRVAAIVSRLGRTHSARQLQAATQIHVFIWRPSMLAPLEGFIVELKSDRTILVQLTTGEIHGYRAQHLWDRINGRTGLPCGQQWLNKAIAAMQAQLIADMDD